MGLGDSTIHIDVTTLVQNHIERTQKIPPRVRLPRFTLRLVTADNPPQRMMAVRTLSLAGAAYYLPTIAYHSSSLSSSAAVVVSNPHLCFVAPLSLQCIR
jgi:hypothetical protein